MGELVIESGIDGFALNGIGGAAGGAAASGAAAPAFIAGGGFGPGASAVAEDFGCALGSAFPPAEAAPSTLA
ncbi:MAG: hypothetical protein ABSG46_04955 [Candidatus Binataceae bacterium]